MTMGCIELYTTLRLSVRSMSNGISYYLLGQFLICVRTVGVRNDYMNCYLSKRHIVELRLAEATVTTAQPNLNYHVLVHFCMIRQVQFII